jgi:hypothetical protein
LPQGLIASRDATELTIIATVIAVNTPTLHEPMATYLENLGVDANPEGIDP